MLYRGIEGQLYSPADLTGTYNGYPIFIVAGSPVIKELPLEMLEASRLPTLALNNVPYIYSNPTMWLTADRPECFGGHLYARADIIKFAYMNHRDKIVKATKKPVKAHPLMFLYTLREGENIVEEFFSEEPVFSWWKSVFPISLQLAWRLGARRVYLVGSSFKTSRAAPYAWDVEFTRRQTIYSQLTYEQDLDRLKELHPAFKDNGFVVVSCTPDSKANDFLPYIDLSKAIEHELKRMPAKTPTSQLRHSSDTK